MNRAMLFYRAMKSSGWAFWPLLAGAPRNPRGLGRASAGVSWAVWACAVSLVVPFSGLEAADGSSSSLPAQVDLRPVFEQWGLSRWRQGSRPTCSAFTVAGALEFAAAKRTGHGTRFSVEFLNWAANQTCGEAEDGGFFSDLWNGYAAYGICASRYLPYQSAFDRSLSPSSDARADAKTRLDLGLRLHWIKEWNVKTGLTEEHLLAIKRTLKEGWPVCGGLRWPKKEQWVENVLQMCPPKAVRDGHSVLLVGYRDDPGQPGGGVFLFRNTAKAGRDGLMPYAYAREYMNDAAWIDCKNQAHVSY